MPAITLATVITNAMLVVTEFGGYIMVAIALVLAPRLIRLGMGLFKAKG